MSWRQFSRRYRSRMARAQEPRKNLKMRTSKAVLLILAALLASAPDTGFASLDLFQGCWKTEVSSNGTANTISFCVTESLVEATVFYPNRGPNSTTCNAKGRIELVDSTRLTIRTHAGSCENGRVLGAAKLDCTVLNRNELNCLHPNFEQIHLWRSDAADKTTP